MRISNICYPVISLMASEVVSPGYESDGERGRNAVVFCAARGRE